MSWLLAFVGISLLIVFHEGGHFAVGKAVGMRVERFSLFFGPILARKQIGETEYALSAIPLGGYVKFTGQSPLDDVPEEHRSRAFYSQPVWKRIAVIAAGPAVNVVLAFLLLFVFFAAIGGQTVSQRVGQIEPGSPAAQVLRPGDRLLAVDGQRGSAATLSKALASHRCAARPPTKGCRAERPATLLVARDGRTVRVRATPVYDPQAHRMRVGFAFAPGPRQTLPLGTAVSRTAQEFSLITRETVTIPAKLFDSQQRKQLHGIVGVYDVTRQVIKDDIGNAVSLLAVISLSLAIINLFPFLPLDGGHIFWALVEKVRRRPVPYSVMERTSVVGIAIVLVVAFIGLSNDIGQLLNGGFNVR